MKIEIRDVPGFLGYGASADGRIWSRRRASGKRGILVAEWRERKRELGKRDGYFMVLTSIDGKPRNLHVHFMVWTAFRGPRPANREINHLDGNKQNNAVTNLELATKSENSLHAIRTGLQPILRGEAHGRHKIKTADVIEIRARAEAGIVHRLIAGEFGISQSHASAIIRGGKWAHVEGALCK